ncbi:MAG: GNAT family protein [Pseudomonadota bacterium]
MTPWIAPLTLEGDHAQLAPLSHEHADDLRAATRDGQLHRLWYTTVPDPDGIDAEIDRRLALQAAGTMLPFAVIDARTGRAVGMTTYMNIDAHARRVEIGSTWCRLAVQRTPLNTECKWLLLRHAFEHLDCIAVEFRTHVLNGQSRRAIERLGAKFDGVLRSHMIMANGTVRDTAVYSIIASEWSTVSVHLRFLLERPRD